MVGGTDVSLEDADVAARQDVDDHVSCVTDSEPTFGIVAFAPMDVCGIKYRRQVY